MTHVNTVEDNQFKLTNRIIKRANKAQTIYDMVACPSFADFLTINRSNALNNNAVIIEDDKIAQQIYGPSVSALMGKETRTTLEHVRTDIIMPVPQSILGIYHQVTLCANILFVGTLVFSPHFPFKYNLP